jgi:methionyl-tRNA formyltransferase
MKPRVVFMGTPEFAVPSLEAVAAACDVPLVITQPDRPAGRGRASTPSPVAVRAEALGLAVERIADLRAPEVAVRLRALAPDLFAVVAFGAILAPEVLAVPRLGAINLHGSLLPDFRGASPVQRALWEGGSGTGVTTIWMDEGIDTGDMILQEWTPISPDDDAASLAARLASLGAPLLARSLVLAHEGRAPRVKQARVGAYAKKLVKQDGAIDWARDAVTVWNRQRAVTPWPGAFTSCRGRRLNVIRARPQHLLPVADPPGTVLAIESAGVTVSCAPGVLRLLRVRPESRSEMEAGEWARGARLSPGERLTAVEEIPA